MNRRASLPGAAELFRNTSSASGHRPRPETDETDPPVDGHEPGGGARAAAPRSRGGSPRQRHDSKITVYVSGDELLALEQARLALRAEHDLVVDRGRMVREAVAVVLADFVEAGADSVLVRRLLGDGEHRDGERDTGQ